MSDDRRMRCFNESWWIDYMEGEVSPGLKQDLDLLLKHSQTDRLILENLQFLRDTIKNEANAPVPENASYYDGLHSKVMSAIENASEFESVHTTRMPLHRRLIKKGRQLEKHAISRMLLPKFGRS